MDRKQKERLRILLKARKRANKVLAKRQQTKRAAERTRQDVERKKLDRSKRLETNQTLMKQYTQDLTALAQQSGILALAEQAAHLRGGRLTQEVSYYVYYGPSGSGLSNVLSVTNQGELRASHLALHITWEAGDGHKGVEVRVHKNGLITFHNSLLPVLPLVWRAYPRLLQKMLDRALQHPNPISVTG